MVCLGYLDRKKMKDLVEEVVNEVLYCIKHNKEPKNTRLCISRSCNYLLDLYHYEIEKLRKRIKR